MTALLDVNVLIALVWPNHVHHEAARAWFTRRRKDGWATCLRGELATFDSGIANLVAEKERRFVCVIPV